MRRAGLALIVGLASACAACGGGGGAASGQFAGLSGYDAENGAIDAMHQEEGDPASPVYKQPLLFSKAEHGQRPEGGQAWVAHFETPAGKATANCILIWSETKAAFQERYGYTLDRCPVGGV